MRRTIRIGRHEINDSGDCFVIAEVGHNHQGNLKTAIELFRAAKDCGADAVKLQKRHNRALYTAQMYNAPYDHEHSFGTTYGAHREALEFGKAEYVELKQLADELDLEMFATVFDIPSADFLGELEMPAYKIASGDLRSIPLIKYVAEMRKPVLLSTGGATLDDVQRAYDTIIPMNRQLAILQCTASYPAEPESLNLRVIDTYRQHFPEAVIGLSDHQNGIALAEAAYLLGARVIEKHFTLNRAWKGTDHAFSLEPQGLRKLVRDLRRIRVALGDGCKQPLPCETKALYKMGKKLVAARDLPEGHVLSEVDIAMKSPNDGLPPFELPKLLGKRLVRAVQTDDNIGLDDVGDAI